ncbi:MAG: DNA mismatch repair endonuclease MutL [Fibrobacter sp.]|nr:DNA mismatch repair endonuclease MutL [Fibrobacter sp.]
MEKSRIHALPEEVINQIAAGEVVERPASVVKELMENALDAGASRIEVQISDGGKSSILIRDNGCGMSEADLDMCYLPHTTSKLRTAEDLFHLATNGFRGEAVASIAAVSKLTITSREEDATEAHLVHLTGGVPDKKTADASPRGTTFFIEDLFFNAPVRKTFLGSDTLEASRVLDTVTRLAMANPNVRIDYKVNGRDVFTGVEGNDLRSRIAEALGAGTARSMIPVDYEEAGIRVSGFAVPPDALKNKRSKLYFYVQKRPIWNPVMTKAVTRAYEPYGSTNAPIAVLFLEMEDVAVDVNVHPNKREVRFANENDVFLAVHHAIRDAFQKPEEDHPTISLTEISEPSPLQSGTAPSMPTLHPEPLFTKQVPLTPKEAPAMPEVQTPSAQPVIFQSPKPAEKTVREKPSKYRSDDPDDIIQDLFSLPENGNIIPLTPQNLRPPTRMDKSTPPQFFQLANTYLVCEDSEGLLLIDQNAAHQRILYEQALNSLSAEGTLESQELLFPEIVEFSAAEASVIPGLLETFDHLGFHLELFGKNTYQLRGTPRDLPFSRSVESLRELVSAVFEGENPGNPSNETLAKAWAKSNAIQAGDKLSTEEMTQLMASLLTTQDPMSSPSGRPTLMRLPLGEIHKRFKR